MFSSTTTIHLYYYQCRWHTVDMPTVRVERSQLDGVERGRKSESAFTPRSVFLDGIDKPVLVSDTRHHEDNPATQATFLRHVESLVRSMSEMGNPFMDSSGDLLVIDTRVVSDGTIVESVQTIEKIGQQRWDSFYKDRLIVRTKQLNDTTTKAKLPLFHIHVHKDKSRQQNQVKALKSDRTLFSTLYIACQVRHTDMADFFSHENQSYPPFLPNQLPWSFEVGYKFRSLMCFRAGATP